MAITLADAQKAWQNSKRQFKTQHPTRTVYLGKGTGYTVEDMIPPGSPNYFYARPSLSNDNWIIVRNTGTGGAPVFNMPVMVGYTDIDDNNETILGVNHEALNWQLNVQQYGVAGTHAPQHGINGADTLFVDSRMFTPGLPRPDETAPTGSLVAYVAPMSYIYDKLYYFNGASTPDLTQYVPDNGQRYVTIAIDARSSNLVIRPGKIFRTEANPQDCTPEEWLTGQCGAGEGGLLEPPNPESGEIPLAAIHMTSDTDYLEWRDNTSLVKNMYDIRPLISAPVSKLVDELDQITDYWTLPTTGAQKPKTPYIIGNIVDNDFYLGNDVIGKVGYGRKIWFQGTDRNSDVVWMSKYNYANDLTTLRVHTSDNPLQKDGFELGISPWMEDKNWQNYFGAYSNGVFEFGTPAPTTEYKGLNVNGVISANEGIVLNRKDILTDNTNYVMGASDTLLFVETPNATPTTIALPAASDIDYHSNTVRQFKIKVSHLSAANPLISPNSTDTGFTIDGSSAITLNPGDHINLFTNGTHWHII